MAPIDKTISLVLHRFRHYSTEHERWTSPLFRCDWYDNSSIRRQLHSL